MTEFREWKDPVTGQVFEIVWAGDMGVSLTGDRLTKKDPVWETPPTREERERKAKVDFDGDPTVSEVLAASGEKRAYNKTGRHAKDPNFWGKVQKDGGSDAK